MSGLSTKTTERLLYLISPIGLLLVWQILLELGFGDRRFVPAPTDIALRFWILLTNGELAMHTGVTLWRVFAGFVVGAVPAVAIGLLMAMFRPVRFFFDPLIAALFPIPKVALMPLLLLAFGFGDASKIALVAIAVFFPVMVNTYVGAANIEKIYWDVAKNYGASQTVMFTRIVFFGALPMIFAGLRIALAVSFIVLVAAEFVATKSGIGYLIWNSWELLQVDVMFVGIVTIGVLGRSCSRRSSAKPSRGRRSENLKSRQRIAREVVAFLDHDLQQERHARFGDAHGILDRGDDVARLLHPHRRDVEALGHLGVVAADGECTVFLGRQLEHV